jgi:hypothetical protein
MIWELWIGIGPWGRLAVVFALTIILVAGLL